MGIIGVLIAVVVLILLMVFLSSPFSPNKDVTFDPKSTENNAQNAVDKVKDKSILEQNQVKKLDSP